MMAIYWNGKNMALPLGIVSDLILPKAVLLCLHPRNIKLIPALIKIKKN
jgi:hypothetical protein